MLFNARARAARRMTFSAYLRACAARIIDTLTRDADAFARALCARALMDNMIGCEHVFYTRSRRAHGTTNTKHHHNARMKMLSDGAHKEEQPGKTGRTPRDDDDDDDGG